MSYGWFERRYVSAFHSVTLRFLFWMYTIIISLSELFMTCYHCIFHFIDFAQIVAGMETDTIIHFSQRIYKGFHGTPYFQAVGKYLIFSFCIFISHSFLSTLLINSSKVLWMILLVACLVCDPFSGFFFFYSSIIFYIGSIRSTNEKTHTQKIEIT